MGEDGHATIDAERLRFEAVGMQQYGQMRGSCGRDNVTHELGTRYGKVSVLSVSALIERLDADAACVSDASHGRLGRMCLRVLLRRECLGMDRIVERVREQGESVFGGREGAGITVRDGESSSTIIDVGVRRRRAHRLDRFWIRDDQIHDGRVAVAQEGARYLPTVGIHQVAMAGLHRERDRRDRRQMDMRIHQARNQIFPLRAHDRGFLAGIRGQGGAHRRDPIAFDQRPVHFTSTLPSVPGTTPSACSTS